MSFQPVVPFGGLPGWAFLNRTMDRQAAEFNTSPLLERDTDYFEQNIGNIRTAEDLVSDRRLLRVALGAFGLEEDLNSRALIQRVLEEGTDDRGALANKLSDSRYKQLTDAFGFGKIGLPNTRNANFGTEITDKFLRREFEVAVGNQDDALRLAMNAQRELADIASAPGSEDAKWLRIMGTPPLRKVFETALRLPEGFVGLDIDRQLDTFKDRAASQLGITNISDLTDETAREDLIRQFLVQDQIAGITAQSSGSIALTLLQSAPQYF